MVGGELMCAKNANFVNNSVLEIGKNHYQPERNALLLK